MKSTVYFLLATLFFFFFFLDPIEVVLDTSANWESFRGDNSASPNLNDEFRFFSADLLSSGMGMFFKFIKGAPQGRI